MDWLTAEQHLKDMEAVYAEIGKAGYFGSEMVIRPLRERFNRGERTETLYNEIMAIK